jgi:serine/threonine-protein kinase
MDDQLPVIDGRYEELDRLEPGAFGPTFKVRDIKAQKSKAIYVLEKFQPSQTTDEKVWEEAKASFIDQYDALCELDKHPRIPKTLDHCEHRQEFYLVRQFIDGVALSQELTPGKTLDESEVVFLLKEMLQILADVHQKYQVIHQNISPSSFVRRSKDAKMFLINFGIINHQDKKYFNSWSSPSSFSNKSDYIPNDQRKDNPQYSNDVYAVGMIGLQARTGLPPSKLPRDNLQEICTPLKTSISPALAEILNKMVCLEPEQPYLSATEALQALKQLPNVRRHGWSWSPNDFVSLASLLVAFATGIATFMTVPWVNDYVNNTWLNKEFVPCETMLPEIKKIYGIQMQCPKDWDLVESPPIDRKISGSQESIVSFEISPPSEKNEAEADKSHEQSIGMILRIEDWQKQPNASIYLQEYTNIRRNYVIQVSRDPKALEFEQTILAGQPGYRMFFVQRDEFLGYETKNLETWTVKGNKLYVITYTANFDKYPKFLTKVEEMIKTFEIK